MPTYHVSSAFWRDFRKLTPEQRALFKAAKARFAADLSAMEAGRQNSFRPGLVRKLAGVPGVFEMRWAPDGRATFSLGESVVSGLRHIEWLRCGTHDILP